jgi:hypothetical protein
MGELLWGGGAQKSDGGGFLRGNWVLRVRLMRRRSTVGAWQPLWGCVSLRRVRIDLVMLRNVWVGLMEVEVNVILGLGLGYVLLWLS